MCACARARPLEHAVKKRESPETHEREGRETISTSDSNRSGDEDSGVFPVRKPHSFGTIIQPSTVHVLSAHEQKKCKVQYNYR